MTLFAIYIPVAGYNVTLLCGSHFPSPVMQDGDDLINAGWEAISGLFLGANHMYIGNFKDV